MILGMSLGPHFESLLTSDGLNYVSFRVCFQVTCCTDLRVELLTAGALKQGGCIEGIAKKAVFAKVLFFIFRW